MEQDKKEKLKNDLAKTPELEAKFNLQMEGIANRVKTITNVLSIEQFKEIGKLYNNRESDYNSLHNEKKELLKHRGIYAPKYAFEFLDWFFDCYLFGKPMHVKEDEGLSLYHFQLYNEYVDRLFEHKNWTDDKERDFLNKQFNNDNRNDLNFDAIHWGAIFYYADTTKLLPKNNKQNKLKAFRKKYNINLTDKYFRKEYYNVVKRINQYNDYPIEALEAIAPFLKQHYPQTIGLIKNDIEILQEYKDENE